VLTVNATDNISGIKEYSFDGGKTWQESNKKSFTSLESVKIKVKDKSGNESEYIPPSPINPKVTEVTDKSATISWTAPTDTIEIAEYKIYCGNNLIGTTKNTSYTIADLENVKEYTFTVKAVNIFGDVSKSSINITVVTGIGVPENVVVETGTNYIDVSWDALSGATEYEVEVGGVIYSGITQNSFRCANLNQGTTYSIKVRAKALTVVGQWSKELKTTTDIPQEVSGAINHNTTWYASKSPYIVTGDIIVDDNITLNIEAGTIIRVKDGCKIVVNGKLVAQGTKDLPIVFTSYYDKDYGGTGIVQNMETGEFKGFWHGIIAESEGSELSINNSKIFYVVGNAISSKGTITVKNSKIDVYSGGGGIFVQTSKDVLVSGNTINAMVYVFMDSEDSFLH
jgi:chitodextrinase